MQAKGRYMSFLFLKIRDDYYAMEPSTRVEVTQGHVEALSKYAAQNTHVLTMGFSGKWDQINILEADDLETLYRMTEDFRMGAKSRAIDIVDAVVGIPLANKAQFEMVGSR